MTWQPNLSEFPTKKGSNKLLWKAFERSQPNRLEYRMKDKEGVFALDTSKGILVAKKYIMGWCVSCHKRAVFSALNQDKPLLMYIKDSNGFYEFNPSDIWKNNEENKRGDAIMLNFSIKLGKRYVTLEEKSCQ